MNATQCFNDWDIGSFWLLLSACNATRSWKTCQIPIEHSECVVLLLYEGWISNREHMHRGTVASSKNVYSPSMMLCCLRCANMNTSMRDAECDFSLLACVNINRPLHVCSHSDKNDCWPMLVIGYLTKVAEEVVPRQCDSASTWPHLSGSMLEKNRSRFSDGFLTCCPANLRASWHFPSWSPNHGLPCFFLLSLMMTLFTDSCRPTTTDNFTMYFKDLRSVNGYPCCLQPPSWMKPLSLPSKEFSSFKTVMK